MREEITKVLFSEEDLSDAVKKLGRRLNIDYAGKSPVVICILKGSVIFFSDLIRQLDFDCTIDFMVASSYGRSTVSSGELKIKKDIDSEIRGKDVIIVEDILDTGNTLSKIRKYLGDKEPASIKICTLIDKPVRREKSVQADYCCFDIDDHFIVGYGLDYDEKYRNLPYIGILDPDKCK